MLFKAEQLSAPKQRVELTGAHGGAVKIETADMSPLELARRIAFILKGAEVDLGTGGLPT